MYFRLILVSASLLYVLSTNACMIAYQFKMFPVGVSNNQIVSVDFKIYRSGSINLNNFKDKEKAKRLFKASKPHVGYTIIGYVSVYNKKQNLISSSVIDTAYVAGKSYRYWLKRLFNRGFHAALKFYPQIELFTPEYISFCDYKPNCKLVNLRYDSIADRNYIIYDRKFYRIKIIRDSTY